MKYIEHLTIDGETWDQIAYRYYGDAHKYPLLIEVNKNTPITHSLKGGVTLIVPIIEAGKSTESLPPWMR